MPNTKQEIINLLKQSADCLSKFLEEPDGGIVSIDTAIRILESRVKILESIKELEAA